MEWLFENDRLNLFLVFAVPGIVLLYFRSRFLAGRMPQRIDGLFTYVTLTLLYHGATYVIFGNVYSFFFDGSRLLLLLFIFVAPAVIGIFSGLGAKKGWFEKALKFFGIDVLHPVDCAWDWHFSNCKECWALVKLKDGTGWAGVLGENSFLSSDPLERDLVMEKVYLIGEDDTWTENTSSVWIAHGEIQSIEMWPKKGMSDDKGKIGWWERIFRKRWIQASRH